MFEVFYNSKEIYETRGNLMLPPINSLFKKWTKVTHNQTFIGTRKKCIIKFKSNFVSNKYV